MLNNNPSFAFLFHCGLFSHANKMIADKNFIDLKDEYNACITPNLQQACAIAEKASCMYGLDGLKLYFPAKIALIKQEKLTEIIDQDIIKTLSIILYLERQYQKLGVDREWLSSQKDQVLALCDKDIYEEVVREANDMSSAYDINLRVTSPRAN